MSNVAASDEIDWSVFGQTRSLNLDDLRRFSSADLDPYTVQLGQRLCERFAFPPQGHRNLSFALSALAEGQVFRGIFDVGFSSQHVVNTTLKSDSGFLLTAIVGALAEYYHEDFVVEFFKLLAKKTNVPEGLDPIELQWRRMVSVFYGVLAPSPFGVLLANFENVCLAGLQDASPETLLKALDSMSNLARHRGKSVELCVGADCVWIASAARWLYDLKVIIQSQALEEIYRSPGVQSLQDADLVLRLSGSSAQSVNASSAALDYTGSESRAGDVITGGRIVFDDIFRSCFRGAFADLDENLLAAYLSCAAHILQESLLGSGKDSRSIFLSQASDKPGVLQHGLIETIAAWFPELQRVMHRVRHYKQLSYKESRKVFDEKVRQLHEKCNCSLCRPDISNSMEICKITLVEVIVSLGLNIARMVVSRKLCPKRNGVIAFYKRHHAKRKSRSMETSLPPSEEFVKTFVETIPSPVEVLKIGFILFAHSEVDADSNMMGMTHAGLAIYLSGRGESYGASGAKNELFVSVAVVPGSMCLYGHEARQEIFDAGVAGWTVEQSWEALRVNVRGFSQIMKWRGEVMLSSFVKKDSEEEQRAREEGWWVL